MDDHLNERMQFSHQSGGLRYDPHGPPQQQRYDQLNHYRSRQQQHFDHDTRRDPRGDRRYGPSQQQRYDQFNHYGPSQQQHFDQRNHYGP